MTYLKITKKTRNLILCFLILTTICASITLTYINMDQNQRMKDSDFNKNIDETFYNEKIPLLGVYSSSFEKFGEKINISFHQALLQTTDIEFSNLDSYSTLIEPCPASDSNFNSSYISIDINHILAPNKTLDIESSDSNGNTDLSSTVVGATHFISRGNGYIENVSVRLTNVDVTNNATCQMVLYAYDSVNNRPAGTNQYDEYAILANFEIPNNTFNKWYDITGIHQLINNSQTDDNKWFIGLFDNSIGGGDMWWDYTRDDDLYGGDNLDETDSFLYVGAWTRYQTIVLPAVYVDFNLKVDVVPLNNTPKPTQINLTINDKEVNDISYQSGIWIDTTHQVNSSGTLHFNLLADWWDISCNVTNVQINYTKTNLKAPSFYKIPGSGQSLHWNSTIGLVNNFDARLDNYKIKFIVPANWENFSAFNGPINKTSDITLGPIINNHRDLQIINADNGTNWFITAQSDNLLHTIHTFVNAVDLSTMYFTDTISFLANFSEVISSGTINLTVYSPTPGYYLNYSYIDSSIDAGSELSLGDWKISDNATEDGVFKVQVWWHNDTAGGFLEKDLTISRFPFDIQRFILVYVMQGIFVIYFSLITFQILRRKRQRLNLLLSAFFVSIIIANILNMIYFVITDIETVLILNFLTNFFLCFGPVFIFMVNMIILESTLIFSVKRQNRYILSYGLIAFLGMFIIFTFFGGVSLDPEWGYPIWEPAFFWYVVSISTCFAVIPFFYTALKIYFSFETKALKKKWFYYILGSLGAFSIGYMAFINNFINNQIFRLILSAYGLSIIIWGYLMYYGIGFKLKR